MNCYLDTIITLVLALFLLKRVISVIVDKIILLQTGMKMLLQYKVSVNVVTF